MTLVHLSNVQRNRMHKEQLEVIHRTTYSKSCNNFRIYRFRYFCV